MGKILVGSKALSIWQQGKEAWNEWSRANPDASVDFFGQTFLLDGQDAQGFRGFDFPSGRGKVSFANTHFRGGKADFSFVDFGEGEVDFSGAEFGDHGVEFFMARFGPGRLDFSKARFGAGSASFRCCHFQGPSFFNDLKKVERCEDFRFDGSRFEQLLEFSHQGQLRSPVDFRQTIFGSQVSVDGIDCGFRRVKLPSLPKISVFYEGVLFPSLSIDWLSFLDESLIPIMDFRKAADPQDTERFRRLKELALNSRNYQKALSFHALEIESKRGSGTSIPQDFAQIFYWLFGNYGQSIFRPLLGLVFTWLAFAATYLAATPNSAASFGTALTYSGSHMLSFIPTGRTARSQGEAILFGDGENVHVPDWVLGIGASESVLSVILLFLLGLGLRNMFRV